MTNRFAKTLAGWTLLFSVLSTGTLAMDSAPAYAADLEASAQLEQTTTTPSTEPMQTAQPALSVGQTVISTGLNFIGVPYRYGSKSGNTSTFDCSSFTQYVFKQNGIDLPRSSKQQSAVGTFVPRDELRPGDLVFFYSPIHHVGIYMGDGKVLHTYGKPGVTITDLNSAFWSRNYTTARRVLPDPVEVVAETPADAGADAGVNADVETAMQPAAAE